MDSTAWFAESCARRSNNCYLDKRASRNLFDPGFFILSPRVLPQKSWPKRQRRGIRKPGAIPIHRESPLDSSQQLRSTESARYHMTVGGVLNTYVRNNAKVFSPDGF